MMQSRKRSSSDERSEKIVTAGLEHGTPELNRKHIIEWERLDYRGLFRRARVVDQTALDSIFVQRKISAPQHEAGEEYLACLVMAGSFIKSPSFERSIDTSVRDVEGAISSRIMAASGARRSLCLAGERSAALVDLLVASNREPTEVELPHLLSGLDRLVRFFGTEGVVDPRDIRI